MSLWQWTRQRMKHDKIKIIQITEMKARLKTSKQEDLCSSLLEQAAAPVLQMDPYRQTSAPVGCPAEVKQIQMQGLNLCYLPTPVRRDCTDPGCWVICEPYLFFAPWVLRATPPTCHTRQKEHRILQSQLETWDSRFCELKPKPNTQSASPKAAGAEPSTPDTPSCKWPHKGACIGSIHLVQEGCII